MVPTQEPTREPTQSIRGEVVPGVVGCVWREGRRERWVGVDGCGCGGGVGGGEEGEERRKEREGRRERERREGKEERRRGEGRGIQRRGPRSPPLLPLPLPAFDPRGAPRTPSPAPFSRSGRGAERDCRWGVRIQWLGGEEVRPVAVVSVVRGTVQWRSQRQRWYHGGANDYPTFFNPGYFWEGVIASSVTGILIQELGNLSNSYFFMRGWCHTVKHSVGECQTMENTQRVSPFWKSKQHDKRDRSMSSPTASCSTRSSCACVYALFS